MEKIEVGTRFTAVETFEAVVNGRASVYVAGMGYTARTPELVELAQGWLGEGKVAIQKTAPRSAQPASVAGVGVVSDNPNPDPAPGG